MRFSLVAILLLAVSAAPAAAQTTVAPDPSSVGPLMGVTVLSGQPDAARQFWNRGLQMRLRETVLSGEAATRFVGHYGLPVQGDVNIVALDRPRANGDVGPVIRLITVASSTPQARPDAAARGVAAVGFAANAPGRLNAIAGSGGVVPTGDRFAAPDGVTVTVRTASGPTGPLAPIDASSGIGGPAFATLVVGSLDAAGRMLADVLGWAARGAATTTADGQRIQTWYAPGSTTGFLELVEARAGAPEAGPGRGVALLSFATESLTAAQARAAKAGLTVRRAPATILLPGTGPVRSMIVETPDGVLLEIYQPL